MRKVKLWLVFDALAGLVFAQAGGANIDVDPDDEPSLERVFEAYVKPRVLAWRPEQIEQLKLTLAFYITRLDFLDHVLASLQDLTMRDPSDIEHYFRCLWRVLFPECDIGSIDVSNIDPEDSSL